MKRDITLFLLMFLAFAASAQTFKVTSPDGKQEAVLDVVQNDGRTVITYNTSYCGHPVVLPSVLDLTIDNHIWEKALAKKAGPVQKWFAGAITNDEGRILEVPTDFLEADKHYVLRVYTDDPSSDSPTKVKCARYIVYGGQKLVFGLQPKGGAAMHFLLASKDDMKAYRKLKSAKVL